MTATGVSRTQMAETMAAASQLLRQQPSRLVRDAELGLELDCRHAIGVRRHAQLGRIGAPIAATRIGNRVALARAMALGLGVVETANATPAAAEITALAEEVRGSLPG